MRDLAHIDAMEPKVKDGARALIVGGGYIGLEAAAVCAKRGVKVTLVEMADRILQTGSLRLKPAIIFRTLHSEYGADIREGVGLDHLTGENGRVTGAVLSDGTKPAGRFRRGRRGHYPFDATGRDWPGWSWITASRPMPMAARPTPISGRRAIAPHSRTRATVSGWKACPMPSTRPRSWPRTCWARPGIMWQSRGSGRISLTSSCKSQV